MKTTLLSAVAFCAAVFRCIAADVTNSFPHWRYAPGEIRIVDDRTKRPLAGALVSPISLGGSPYATNTYRTDPSGFVKATFIEGGLAAVQVTMAGCQTSSVVLLQSNRVVRMRRSQ